MIPSSFTQGVWGKSWEEARGDNAVQGTANLGDEGVVLDIPCGKLLGSPGVIINGEKEPSAAEHLYGFSQDGYALVLGNAAYNGGETHYPGMVHLDGEESAIQYYAPLIDSPAPSKNAIRAMPFPYRALEGEIGNYLYNWFDCDIEKRDKKDYLLLKRASDLIVSILTYDWKMPVELQCVSASQALEALSRYRADLQSWPKAKLKQNRKELLKRIEGMPEEFVTWVRSRIEQNSKGAKCLMSELMDKQKDAVGWLVPDIDKFVSEQQDARNTYSHGSSAVAVDPSRLYQLTMGIALVGYAIL